MYEKSHIVCRSTPYTPHPLLQIHKAIVLATDLSGALTSVWNAVNSKRMALIRQPRGWGTDSALTLSKQSSTSNLPKEGAMIQRQPQRSKDRPLYASQPILGNDLNLLFG